MRNNDLLDSQLENQSALCITMQNINTSQRQAPLYFGGHADVKQTHTLKAQIWQKERRLVREKKEHHD